MEVKREGPKLFKSSHGKEDPKSWERDKNPKGYWWSEYTCKYDGLCW